MQLASVSVKGFRWKPFAMQGRYASNWPIESGQTDQQTIWPAGWPIDSENWIWRIEASSIRRSVYMLINFNYLIFLSSWGEWFLIKFRSKQSTSVYSGLLQQYLLSITERPAGHEGELKILIFKLSKCPADLPVIRKRLFELLTRWTVLTDQVKRFVRRLMPLLMH